MGGDSINIRTGNRKCCTRPPVHLLLNKVRRASHREEISREALARDGLNAMSRVDTTWSKLQYRLFGVALNVIANQVDRGLF